MWGGARACRSGSEGWAIEAVEGCQGRGCQGRGSRDAHFAVRVHVGVPEVGGDLEGGGHVGVVLGELHDGFEEAALTARTSESRARVSEREREGGRAGDPESARERERLRPSGEAAH